jgi:hypothetical protein
MRLMRTKGRRRAVVAVARKLAILLHRMWIEGSEFRQEQVGGTAWTSSACSEPPLIYSTRSFVWLLLFPTQKLEKALGDGIVIAISTSAHAFIQIVFVE